MKEEKKTKEQLLNELKSLSLRIIELEKKQDLFKESEESLIESGKIFRLISENTSDFISLLGLSGIFTYVNPSFQKLGYEKNDLIGRLGFDFIHPEDIAHLHKLLMIKSSAINNDNLQLFFDRFERTHLKYRFAAKSGDWVDFESTVDLIIDDKGKPSSVLVISRDVTKHKREEEELKELLNTFDTYVVKLDQNGVVCMVNDSALIASGISEDEFCGKYFPEIGILSHSEEEKEKVINSIYKAVEGITSRIECTFSTEAGDIVPVVCSSTPIIDKDGNLKYITLEGKIIIEQKRLYKELEESKELLEKRIKERTERLIDANKDLKREIENRKIIEDALIRSEARFKEMIESLPESIFELNLKGEIIYLNRVALETFGYSQKELRIGVKALQIVIPEDRGKVLENISRVIKGEELELFEITIQRKDGDRIPVILHINAIHDEKGELIGSRGILINITEKKKAEEQLMHNAYHDKLTGLPNRALFIDRLRHSIELAKRNSDYKFAVLFLDLDNFKVINDSLGHLIGDSLLVMIAERLVECLRPSDLIARLGGDEFTILLDNINDSTDALHIVERVQDMFSRSFLIKGHEIYSTASIGITLSNSDYQFPDDILRDADIAMYRAKELGRGYYELFDKKMHMQVMKRLKLETDLRIAFDRNEFFVYYQPIVSFETGKITGFEALLRWMHPKYGLLFPDRFIFVLEETGLILPIGKWVLREACSQLVQWQKEMEDIKDLHMNVNLSAKQFQEPNLIVNIKNTIIETGIDPDCLILEITENIIMETGESTIETLMKLRDMNIKLAVDDFGTGYSSLSYLHRFPLSILKIDYTFIRQMNENSENIEIVKTIVNLAHNLGMDVVSEGVETEDQLEILKSLKCENGQGFLFSEPVDSIKAKLLIEENMMLLKM